MLQMHDFKTHNMLKILHIPPSTYFYLFLYQTPFISIITNHAPLKDRTRTIAKCLGQDRRSNETSTSNGKQIPTMMASWQRSMLLNAWEPLLRMEGSPAFITGKLVMGRRDFGWGSAWSLIRQRSFRNSIWLTLVAETLIWYPMDACNASNSIPIMKLTILPRWLIR